MLDRIIKNAQGWVLQDYGRYKAMESLYRHLNPDPVPRPRYPADINLELTSYCNAKCVFCTHEHLVKSGMRPQTHMDLGAARRTIDRLRTLLDTLGVPDREIRFSPVGLGEPLLHPNIFEVIAYARQKFPQAMIHANTNGLVLKGEHAARLIASGLDRLIISLCYNDPVAYKESLGVDRYAQVVENAKAFLRAKGNRLPNTIVHIFDVPENSKRFSAFIREWTPFLNRNDMAGLYHYLPLTDWSPKPGDKAPCNQPWNVLMVDVEGYLFPCCIGVWTRQDDDLCLGHIEDSTADLVEKLNRVRRRHLDHDFRICGGCSVLSADCARNQWFHDKLKKHPDWLFVNIPGQDFRELP